MKARERHTTAYSHVVGLIQRARFLHRGSTSSWLSPEPHVQPVVAKLKKCSALVSIRKTALLSFTGFLATSLWWVVVNESYYETCYLSVEDSEAHGEGVMECTLCLGSKCLDVDLNVVCLWDSIPFITDARGLKANHETFNHDLTISSLKSLYLPCVNSPLQRRNRRF